MCGKLRGIPALAIMLEILLLSAMPTVASARTDHKYFIDQYRGPAQCMGCHAYQLGNTPPISLSDIHKSVHYRWESKLPDHYRFDAAGAEVEYATSGLLWEISDYSSTLPHFNWLSIIHDLPETPHLDKVSGCATCHVGIGNQPYSAQMQHVPSPDESNNIDCLVCHAANYTRKYYADSGTAANPPILTVPSKNGKLDWSVYTEAARTVGSTVPEACLRCHSGSDQPNPFDDLGYGDDCRGVKFTPETDVHAAAGKNCTFCHYAGSHKMKRPLNNDLSAHDQVVDHQMCQDCHGDKPHSIDTYNQHAGFFSCTACHARSEGAQVVKDFSAIVPPDPNNPLSIFNVNIETIDPDYHVQFAWFDGTVEENQRTRGSRGDGKSRLYPYTPVDFNRPMDANNQVIPLKWADLYKNGDMNAALNSGTAAYAAMWTPELQAGYGLPPAPGPLDHYAAADCGGFSISHGITKDRAYKCASCHNPNSVVNFDELGYSADEIDDLENMLGLPAVGDLNDDGKVDATDLILFQQYWHGSEDAMLKALQKMK